MLTIARGHRGSALLFVVLGSALAVDHVVSPPAAASAGPATLRQMYGLGQVERLDRVRDGLALGYRVVLPSDASASRDLPRVGGGPGAPAIDHRTVHEASLAALADRFADVLPTDGRARAADPRRRDVR